MKSTVKGVGGELGGVALCRREATNCLIDGVYIDQSSLENGRAIDHFGDRSGRCASGPAALGIEGNGVDASTLDEERDPREIPAGSAPRSAREGTVNHRTKPALVTQVVLEKLTLHAFRVKRRTSNASSRAITHTYLPGGCG